MRATISAGLATLALGALAGAASLGCENTASDCKKLGTVCTGGSGGGGTGGGGTGGTGGTTTTTSDGGGGMGGGGMGGATTSSTSTTTQEPCPVLKVKSFGDVADQSASSLLVTSASDVVIAGGFFGNLQFGMAELTAPGPDPSFFVARSGPELAPNFAQRLDATYRAGALDASGSLVAVGIQSGAVDLGCGSVSFDPSFAVGLFVVKLDSLGVCVFHEAFGATAVPSVNVAVGPSGEIVIAGGYEGSLLVNDAVGALPLTSVGGTDIFVAKLTDTGAHLWSESYGDVGEDQARAVAIHTNGRIVVAGDHEGGVDFNDGSGTLDSGASGAPFVAVFGSNGVVPWARSFQVTGGPQGAFGVAIDSSVAGAPEIVLSGDLTAVQSTKLVPGVFGDQAVSLVSTDHAVFLARFALDDTGKHLSSKAYEGAGKLAVNGTAVDSKGRILLAGWFDQSLTFAEGAGVLTSGGVARAFMAVLGKDLVHQKSLGFGGADGESRAFGAAFEGDDALVAGSYSGTMDVQGQVMVTSKGGDDIFVARLCAE